MLSTGLFKHEGLLSKYSLRRVDGNEFRLFQLAS